VIDSAPFHIKNNESYNDIIFTPKGGTYLIQPFDVCIGKPYKDAVRKMFYEYFLNGNEILTSSNIIKRPKKEEIINMHIRARELISTELIIKSSKITGFTSNLDAPEIDLSYKSKDNTDFTKHLKDLKNESKKEFTYAAVNDIKRIFEDEGKIEHIDVEECENNDFEVESINEEDSSKNSSDESGEGKNEEKVYKIIRDLKEINDQKQLRINQFVSKK